MSHWTQADVDAINARRGAKLPAHVGMNPSSPLTAGAGQTGETITTSDWSAKPAKAHKYRAEPCIVTADLTLFTAKEIHAAEAAEGHPLTGTGSLKDRAARVGISGEWFGSTKEAKRWIELKRRERVGEILNLRTQEPYELCVNGVTIGQWRADFVYDEIVDNSQRWTRVEDVKGIKTALYRWKKKHVEAQYGITIQEV